MPNVQNLDFSEETEICLFLRCQVHQDLKIQNLSTSHMTSRVQSLLKKVPMCGDNLASHLAIGDVLAVDLEELLCESLFLFGGG